MDNKGQAEGPGMVIIAAFIVLAVIGIVQLVSVTITSKVSTNIEGNLALDRKTTTNETVNVTMMGTPLSDNSTALAQDGFITGSDIVANATNATKLLTRDTDYKITLSGASGAVTTVANFTILSIGYNITEVKVTYDTNEETAYHTTKDNLVSNNLSSFELGGTAQIVFAAIVVLTAVFGLLAVMRTR